MTVKPPQELVDYLITLISPPDMRASYIETVDDIDFKSYADNSVCGLLVKGTPTVEQSKELERILMPGAHLLLIAPDEEETGHTGACRIEDAGFEIRDSILWVREAGGFHYVPKASRSEREEGCNSLPAKTGAAEIGLPENSHMLGYPGKGPGRTQGNDLPFKLKTDVSDELKSVIKGRLTDKGVGEDVLKTPVILVRKEQIPPDLLDYFEPDVLLPDGDYEDITPDDADVGLIHNFHPTIKPYKLMERLLDDIPVGEGPALDPFMGSGSTGIACLRHKTKKHDFIGVDREEDYLIISDARIRHHAGVARVNDANYPEIISEAPKVPVKAPKRGAVYNMCDDDFVVTDVVEPIKPDTVEIKAVEPVVDPVVKTAVADLPVESPSAPVVVPVAPPTESPKVIDVVKAGKKTTKKEPEQTVWSMFDED